jgi:hypothetical protein
MLLLTVFALDTYRAEPQVVVTQRVHFSAILEPNAVDMIPSLWIASVTLNRTVLRLQLQLLRHRLGVKLAVSPFACIIISHPEAHNVRIRYKIVIVGGPF